MILNDEQKKEFEKIVRPVIEYLNKDCFHPHTEITIDCEKAQLFESINGFMTQDYIKD